MALDPPQTPLLGLRSGLTTAVVSIPGNIAFGYLAFTPLGPEWANLGALVGIFTSLVGGVIAAMMGSNPGLVSGPKAPTSLVFATVLSQTIAWLGESYNPSQHAGFVLGCGLAVVCASGLIQVALGSMKLGRMIQAVPYAVVIGFVQATALLLLISQAPVILGLSLGSGTSNQPGWFPMNAMVGIVTAASMLIADRLKTRVPAPIVALLVGAMTHQLIGLGDWGTVLGPTLPRPEFQWLPTMSLEALNFFMHQGQPAQLVSILATSAFAMAVLNSVDTLLSSLALEHLSQTSGDGDRELIAQGTANTVGGAFGTLSCAGIVARTTIHFKAGGHTRSSVALACVLVPTIVWLAQSILTVVPLSSIAGILTAIGIQMVDQEVIDKLRAFARGDRTATVTVTIVVVMVLVGAWFSIISSVILGLAISVVFFLRSLSRDLISGIRRSDELQSRCFRNQETTKLLKEHAHEILIYDLSGPLFFGSAQTLKRRIERAVRQETRYLILNMRRVNCIDTTGSKILEFLDNNIARDSLHLLFCNTRAPESTNSALSLPYEFPELAHSHIFEDIDRALEFAEAELLEELGVQSTAMSCPIEEFTFFRDLGPDQQREMLRYFTEVSYPPTSSIITQDDWGDSLFMLTRGTVDVIIDIPDSTQTIRVYSMCAGVFFGEMALFTETKRTANIVARENVECLRISRPEYLQMDEKHPALASALTRYITVTLADRLQNANEVIIGLTAGH